MSQPAWIGLGSNLGESKKTLQQAWEKLGKIPEISLLQLSSPWRTAPIGMESDNWFTNAVGKVSTQFSPEELLTTLLKIEEQFGRHRSTEVVGYQDRTLDLDLLYFGEDGQERRNSPSLYLPHRKIGKRLFVLQPLDEIEPNLYDPVTARSVGEMLSILQESTDGKEQQITLDCWSEDKRENHNTGIISSF